MSSLYSLRTFRLSALGHGVLLSHQTRLTAPFTRILRTFTHSAGAGKAPGLYQLEADLLTETKEEVILIEVPRRHAFVPYPADIEDKAAVGLQEPLELIG